MYFLLVWCELIFNIQLFSYPGIYFGSCFTFWRKKFLTSVFKNGVSYFTKHSFLVHGIISISTETFFPALGSFDYIFTSLVYFPNLLIELKCSRLSIKNKLKMIQKSQDIFLFQLGVCSELHDSGGENVF